MATNPSPYNWRIGLRKFLTAAVITAASTAVIGLSGGTALPAAAIARAAILAGAAAVARNAAKSRARDAAVNR